MLNLIVSSFNSFIVSFDLVGLLLASISLLVLFFYYFNFFSRLSFYNKESIPFNCPVSIVICAKNELENLQNNLPLFLQQNYFNFEVIVVNDQSTDHSIFFLEELAAKNKNLVVVNIDDFVTHGPGKKFALTLGIKTAKYEHLLLTDADCSPDSENWVKAMTSGFNNGADIILGYGAYKRQKGLLNKMIRFDSFNVAQHYLSFALAGHTYMGVGRNLAYKKSLFFENKGFASHMHIPSGDDDLFIQEISKKCNVLIDITQDAHTTSVSMESWRDWVYQKRRHLSTSPFYSMKFKFLLALYPFAQLLFILALLLFLFNENFLYVAMFLAIKLFVSYFVNYKVMKRLNVFDMYWLHPLYALFHLLIQGNFVLLNLFVKPKKWSR